MAGRAVNIAWALLSAVVLAAWLLQRCGVL